MCSGPLVHLGGPLAQAKGENMTTKKELTAAEKYAKLKSDAVEAFLEASFSNEALKGVDLYEVKCPSGMTFKCRRLDARYQANAGQMPMAVTASMLSARDGYITPEEQDQAAQKSFDAMTPTEQRAAIQASAQMVRYIVVEPRLIVGDIGNQTNAISVDMLTMDDFTFLSKWAGGGVAAEGLKTFRRKRK